MKKVLFILMIVLLFLLAGPFFRLLEENRDLRNRNEDLKNELKILEERIFILENTSVFPIPEILEEITFCGERVPLEREYVYDRLIEALVVELESSFSFRKTFLRTGRWFPFIEQELRKAGLPLDLKYLAVIESGLNCRAYSSAKARGLWQLTNLIVKAYGGRADWWINEAYDPFESTKIAVKHLGDLYSESGNWPDSLAGYNMNKNKYKKRLEEQGADDYYKGRKPIPWQTQKFVYRAIAIKLIMENPEKYGFESWKAIKQKSFKPWKVKRIKLTVKGSKKSRKTIIDIVKELKEKYPGFTYQKFVDYNRHILRDQLPPDTYNIYIPEEIREETK